ncbi:hypothetical protein FQZ97_1032780 [compost metagenome]
MAFGRQGVVALGATPEEADEVIDDLRRRDKERLVLEMSGGLFAGRALVQVNTETRQPH